MNLNNVYLDATWYVGERVYAEKTILTSSDRIIPQIRLKMDGQTSFEHATIKAKFKRPGWTRGEDVLELTSKVVGGTAIFNMTAHTLDKVGIWEAIFLIEEQSKTGAMQRFVSENSICYKVKEEWDGTVITPKDELVPKDKWFIDADKKIDENTSNIGTMAKLDTTYNNNLVGAINENHYKIGEGGVITDGAFSTTTSTSYVKTTTTGAGLEGNVEVNSKDIDMISKKVSENIDRLNVLTIATNTDVDTLF